MKVKKTLFLLIPVITLVLEALPYGAVLIFADMEESLYQTFSYFSLTPFGYANFGPFVTSVLTCLLLLLGVISALRYRKGLNTTIIVVSAVAFVASLAPLFFGIDYFTIIGAVISVLLAAELCASLLKPKA